MNVLTTLTLDSVQLAMALLQVAADPKAAKKFLESVATDVEQYRGEFDAVRVHQIECATREKAVIEREAAAEKGESARVAAVQALEAVRSQAETRANERSAALDAISAELDAKEKALRQATTSLNARAAEVARQEALYADRLAAVAERESAVSRTEQKFRAALDV
jgi:hypothetical protein